MVDKVFLTDTRRDVLEGTADQLNDQSLLNEKSRIRKRARLAIEELIEVADSPEIDNETVFEPELVGKLVQSIISDGGGLIENTDYRNEIYVELDRPIRLYQTETKRTDLTLYDEE